MCHPDEPAQQGPSVTTTDALLPLPEGEWLPAELAQPAPGQGPGVLLITDIYGGTSFYRHLHRRLADAGYTSLMPDIFFREGELGERTREAALARRARLDEGRALGDLLRAAEWLGQHEAVSGARLGLLGFCLGGTLALDMCAERDGLAAVCYYAFPSGMCGSNAPAPLDVVPDVTGPVLAFWGDEDYIDMDEIEKLRDMMAKHGRNYNAIIYTGVGHGFLSDLGGEQPGGNAAHDSWRRSLAFFAQHLSTEPAGE